MTTKFKILSSVAFIALAIVLTFVGVWALTDLDFTVGGNITYTAPEPSVELYRDETDTYWYVKMGSTADVSEIRWRLVGLNGERYTSKEKPTSGQGTFILETLIDYNALKKTFDADSNDYATSDIRTYLTNESEGGYIYDILGIKAPATDAIYSAIDARDMNSLYADIGWNCYGNDSSYAENEVYTIETSASGADKLWLMSVKEVYTLLGGGTIGSDDTIPYTWSQEVKDGCNWDAENTRDYYWLRSPSPDSDSYAFFVDYGGGWSYDFVDITYAVRPAFNLNF